MTAAAWLTMLATWAAVTWFAGRSFWLVMKKKSGPDQSPD